MKILEKLAILKEERYLDLDQWQRKFIRDIYSELLGPNGNALPKDMGFEDVKEYLSPEQIRKVNEAWEEVNS